MKDLPWSNSYELQFGLCWMERRFIYSFRNTRIVVRGVLVMPLCRSSLNRSGYTFRKDGRYFVLAERHKARDTIGVYDTKDGYKVARV